MIHQQWWLFKSEDNNSHDPTPECSRLSFCVPPVSVVEAEGVKELAANDFILRSSGLHIHQILHHIS